MSSSNAGDAVSDEDLKKRVALGPVSPENVCRRRCRRAIYGERYLYEDHTRKQIAGWAKRLNYFRFCRAYGGHSNDGDSLMVVLSTPDEASLLATCEVLGIQLLAMPDEAGLAAMFPEPEPFSSHQFPEWQQPGYVVIAGVQLYAWLGGYAPKDDTGRYTGEYSASLRLSLADNVWYVTETAVAHAEAIENILQPLAAQMIDPPQDDSYCFSPKRYPEMFGLGEGTFGEWPWDEPDPH